METKTIKTLSNEEYHRGTEYSKYISSSQLRNYLVSPAYYRQKLSEPNETTPAMELGSLVHDALEFIHNTGDFSLSAWHERKAVFEPPVNSSTGKAYGADTKKYAEAYQQFLETADGKQIVPKDSLDIAHAIARSVENDLWMSRLILKGEAEHSLFVEDGLWKAKVRPDLLLNSALIDYKTFSGDLSESKLVNRVLDSGYHIQMAMYQDIIHEVTGRWVTPYLLFMQTCEPYGIQMMSLNRFCYTIADGELVNDDTIGAREYRMLKELHIHCLEDNDWPGSDIFVQPDDKGRRIMEPEVPAYAINKIKQYYFTA